MDCPPRSGHAVRPRISLRGHQVRRRGGRVRTVGNLPTDPFGRGRRTTRIRACDRRDADRLAGPTPGARRRVRRLARAIGAVVDPSPAKIEALHRNASPAGLRGRATRRRGRPREEPAVAGSNNRPSVNHVRRGRPRPCLAAERPAVGWPEPSGALVIRLSCFGMDEVDDEDTERRIRRGDVCGVVNRAARLPASRCCRSNRSVPLATAAMSFRTPAAGWRAATPSTERLGRLRPVEPGPRSARESGFDRVGRSSGRPASPPGDRPRASEPRGDLQRSGLSGHRPTETWSSAALGLGGTGRRRRSDLRPQGTQCSAATEPGSRALARAARPARPVQLSTNSAPRATCSGSVTPTPRSPDAWSQPGSQRRRELPYPFGVREADRRRRSVRRGERAARRCRRLHAW